MICDFCADRQVEWSYNTKVRDPKDGPFKVKTPIGELSFNNVWWAACDPCHALIERESWEGLLARATLLAPTYLRGLHEQDLMDTLLAIQKAFRQTRVGIAQRV